MAATWRDALVVGGVKVKPTAKSLVVPATPTKNNEWLSLTNLDRVVNPTFSSAILFYNNLLVRNDQTFGQIAASLKETLAKVLVDFYPLAGRLMLRDEDGLVDLYCNDQGAVFIEASVDAELSQIGGAQPMPALSGMEIARIGSGPLYIPDQLKSMPVLIIQVTKFTKCGSIAIAVNWHHTIADGSSGCHFMKSWAEVAMGKNLSVKPDHNRDLLRPRNPLNPSLVNGYSTQSVQDLLTREVIFGPDEPAILKSFPLSKQGVQKLKSLAKTEECEYTSAEAISGHLWQLMTKARSSSSTIVDDHDNIGKNSYEEIMCDPEENSITQLRNYTTRFFMFVDGRKKLGLPAGYFGNVVCSACAMSNEYDILKNPVSFAANLIRRATRSISGEYFRSLIDWVEEQGHAPSKSEHVNSVGHDVAATFWTFFPLYEMDFGWGKPSYAARNSGPRPLIDGIAMMPSPDGAGNMVALLNLHADRMAKLQKDPAFSTAYSISESSC